MSLSVKFHLIVSFWPLTMMICNIRLQRLMNSPRCITMLSLQQLVSNYRLVAHSTPSPQVSLNAIVT